MEIQGAKKKTDPWTIEFIKGAFFLLVGEVMIFYLPFFDSRYLQVSFLAASIWLVVFGCFIFHIGHKYWDQMVNRSDRLTTVIGGLSCFVFGIAPIIFDWFPTTYPYTIFFPALYCVTSLVAGILFSIIGGLLFRENYRSPLTLLFFFFFLCFGIAWIINILYFITRLNSQTYDSFLIFFLFHFLAILLLIHACRALITPAILLQRTVYFFLGIGFSVIVILVIAQLKHTIMFTIVYGSLFFLLVSYSVIRLTFYPEWLTEDRKGWVRRIRTGLLPLAITPMGEALVDLPVGFLQENISLNSPIPKIFVVLALSISLTYVSGLIIFSGLPDIEIWFFDEVKLRAVSDLKEINPEVNLSAIWEQVDEWQKETDLIPREMTTQKLEEYVQAAKRLVLVEGTPARG